MSKWKGLENEVAKHISQWLFGDPKVLRRSPCSGGWKARGSDGDVILASDKEEHKRDFMFCIEVKCRASRGGKDTWHFEQLLTSPKHPILDWWYQLSEESPVIDGGKLRLLVFSKTSGLASAYAALGTREMYFIEQKAGISLRAMPKIVFEVGRCEDTKVETEVIRFFNFRELIDFLDAEKLKKAWNACADNS